ncbi:P-loop containing nucleoside triphosphate hydrolase protein [Glomus cerebriforme]|uniref:RNA helicase n=1 Tax=Glomus cerebriforme TaxID=658196 RepID=A0A397SX62_9GLOM|nr:P-loop containing nucleoside triphosphate hydrolase protein [Glomus cerebriforme]
MDPTLKKMSSKKKKRLEKYIEKKIKKEERVMLIEKLSKTSFSSELMKSSKNLGRGKETMRERLRKAYNEKRLGLPQSDLSVPLFVDEGEEDEEEEKVLVDHVMIEDEITKDHSLSKLPVFDELNNDQNTINQSVIVGSALKRGPDGEFTIPIKKKKKKKIKKKQAKLVQKSMLEEDSFDSSDSQYDTDKETENSEAAISEKSKESKGQSFKQWATEQMGIKLKDNQNKSTIYESQSKPTNLQQEKDVEKKVLIQDGIDITLGNISDNEESNINKSDETKAVKKAFYVPIERNKEIQEARMELPICAEEQIIMETISNNPVVIICGETGSGKTTQIPQFLYEAGYSSKDNDNPGIIGITQPRRVAAVSMSKRVAQELSLSEQEVSYQIRYDATISPKTVIKFMTDGVLLRELANDFLLSKYSAIIIDEAHERSLNTDILIGAVSRVLKLRAELSEDDGGKIKPLKIIIMSATLRVSDFTQNKNLFDMVPPIINVSARQFPVSIHFNRRTPNIDYVSEAFKKVCKIHTRLPHGGILVFLTGQNEISILCKKLRRKFPYLTQYKSKQLLEEEKIVGDVESLTAKEADVEIGDLDIGDKEVGEELFDTDSEDSEENDEITVDERSGPLYVLPLYSLLSTHAQLRVFEAPPEGTRLCVVATNVAETSLTIPGIKYVVDCGKVKERRYDVITGVQSYVVDWTSKASADQRAGRAGRTGPGHCYRLFSSAVFNDQFQQFTIPEVYRMPIEGIVLQMKAMNIDTVYNFPFPTPPDRNHLRKAERLLQYMNALDENGGITELGRVMATFPVAPRFSKMLIIGQQHGCLPYIIAIVSALSVADPFIKDYHLDISMNSDDDVEEEDNEDFDVRYNELSEIQKEAISQKEHRKLIRKRFYDVQKKHAGLDPTSDILKLLNVVGAYVYEGGTDEFCERNFVRPKAMEEIHKLRRQITNIVQVNCPGVDVCLDSKMKPPSIVQLKAIRQIITAGFIDQIAIRKGLIDKSSKIFSSARNVEYCTMWADDNVFIHPTSILYHHKPPDFVVYQELHRTSKVWMKGITVIESSWLSKLGKSLCTFSKPVDLQVKSKKNKDTEKIAYVIPSFGPKNWELPPIKIIAQKVNNRWVYGSI